MNPAALLPLADRLDALLPQTQCMRCGYDDCRAYAEAMARDEAPHDQCPPGGAEGVARLAAALGRGLLPLNPLHGAEGPRRLAVIDEAACIGCTLCIQACPVDCILGAPKQMHTVIEPHCNGCELCVLACPVDCIAMLDRPAGEAPEATGWAAWSPTLAEASRTRYVERQARRARLAAENEARLAAQAQAKLDDLASHSRLTDPAQLDRKKAVIEAAMARARERAGARDAAAPAPARPGADGPVDA